MSDFGLFWRRLSSRIQRRLQSQPQPTFAACAGGVLVALLIAVAVFGHAGIAGAVFAHASPYAMSVPHPLGAIASIVRNPNCQPTSLPC